MLLLHVLLLFADRAPWATGLICPSGVPHVIYTTLTSQSLCLGLLMLFGSLIAGKIFADIAVWARGLKCPSSVPHFL